jgi:hypothetical protein
MSAQGGTLARRGALHLPIWPVAVLLAAAVAAAIGMSVLGGTAEHGVVASVTDGERFANSSAAVREQGAVMPELTTIPAIDPVTLEGSAAAVREQGAYIHGLENPSVWATTVREGGTYAPGAYAGEAGTFTPRVEGRLPIVVNGEICGQCR